jgi:hypothetical protein
LGHFLNKRTIENLVMSFMFIVKSVKYLVKNLLLKIFLLSLSMCVNLDHGLNLVLGYLFDHCVISLEPKLHAGFLGNLVG